MGQDASQLGRGMEQWVWNHIGWGWSIMKVQSVRKLTRIGWNGDRVGLGFGGGTLDCRRNKEEDKVMRET